MKIFLGILLLVGMFFFYVFLEGVTCSFIYEKMKQRFNWLGRISVVFFSSCIYISVFIFLQVHHYHKLDILGYLKKAVTLNVTFQDLQFFFVSLLLCFVMSCAVGVALRILFYNKREIFTITKTNEHILLVSVVLMVGVYIFGVYIQDYSLSHMGLNEIKGNNVGYQVDGTQVSYDYIELFNDGILPCRLDDLYLSDNMKNLKKLSLHGIEIEAKGFYTVYLDDLVSFAIKQSGETIYLSNDSGQILEQVEYEDVGNEMSLSRMKDGSELWTAAYCTPDECNENGVYKYVEKPELSHKSGFYDEEFDLTITASGDTTIFYSIDGSAPDETSMAYETPIHIYDISAEENRFRSIDNVVEDWKNNEQDKTPVDKAFILRAVAIDADGNQSDVVTETYFIQKEKYEAAQVVSIVADPEQLFGDNGIYVTGKEYDEWYLGENEGEKPIANFFKGGKEWEIPADMAMLNENNILLHQDIGLRIQGGTSRIYGLKRFSVYAREEYSGSERFDYAFWEDGQPIHSFVLRNGFADVICQDIAQDRNVAIQRSVPVTVFLNGEYWYDTYLREKYSSLYFEDQYGIAKDDLIICLNGTLDEGVETDQRLFMDLYSYIEENDLADSQKYEEFGEIIDIQNYIDYLCINICTANMDFDEYKNALMWRSRTKGSGQYQDGRWRWALYDMDSQEWNYVNLESYGVEDDAAINSFTQDPVTAGAALNQRPLFVALKRNETFCRDFVLSFMDIVNTDFTEVHAKDVLEKWGSDITYFNSFFVKRPQYTVKHLAEEFGLTGTLETLTININNSEYGTIRINTITPNFEKGSWSGQYFTDYPVTITAIPNEGYRFVKWTGEQESFENQLLLPLQAGGVTVNAVFEKEE